MQTLGIVRKLDNLGRIVLPMELRRTMEIKAGDGLEIFTNENNIILRKYMPKCIFTGSMENLILYKGKMISSEVMEEISKLYKVISEKK